MDLFDIYLYFGIVAIGVQIIVIIVVGFVAISRQEAKSPKSSGSSGGGGRGKEPRFRPKGPSGGGIVPKVEEQETSRMVDGKFVFSGAPASFQPEIEPVEDALRAILGEDFETAAVFDPMVIERLEHGDEVKRHIMWVHGRGQRCEESIQQWNILESKYWMGKEPGEDFPAWYTRDQNEQLEILNRHHTAFHEEYIRPVMEGVSREPDFVALTKDKTGELLYVDVRKDGKTTRKLI